MKNYSIGLDIGSNSVGWAVVDDDNELVRKNGFTFWGVRMFEEAQSAADRRMYRNSRRRLVRRKNRINLLQQLFKDEIDKVDKHFFQRLNDSFFKKEDKLLKNRYTFFDDDYNDQLFFKEYPTIYHLRKALITSNKKEDIRKVYLACHNIIKYRGNFLNEKEDYERFDDSQIKESFETINNYLLDYKSQNIDDEDYFDEIKNIYSDSFYKELKGILLGVFSKSDKKNKLLELFSVEKSTFVNEFVIPLLLGSEVKVDKLSFVKDLKYEKNSLDLSSEEWELKLEEIQTNIKELSDLLLSAYEIKKIRDSYYLMSLLGNRSYISDAMIDVYEKHKKQLQGLKNLVKNHNDLKNSIFRYKDKTCNYAKYIGMCSENGKIKRFSHCTKEEFYKFLRDILSKNIDILDKTKVNEILSLMENGEYLLRQNSGQNTIIPMQLNLMELKKILDKQSNYYDFLRENNDKITVTDKIISIFKYHIPYYIGPINKNSQYGWAIRNRGFEDDSVLPWNIESIINYDETAKSFITRMQNKCTYLKGQDDYCLPKKSLLFSEFNCLQYLNKLTINGEPISLEIKQKLFSDVFLRDKKPTRKRIVEYLKCNLGMKEEEFTSKIDEVNCDMSSYIAFKDIFGKDFETNRDAIEEIIKDITIFEDKKVLEKRLKMLYKLDDEKIKKIKTLNYSGYGSISKRLLLFKTINSDTGECSGSIIDIMRNTNMNLQQILYDNRYNFLEEIDNYNKKNISKEDEGFEEFIENNIYTSPIMKRSLIQAYKLIEEIEKILGGRAKKYYIECTRTNKEEKKNSVSRYNKIKDLLAECKKQSLLLKQSNIDINHLDDTLKKYQDNPGALRSDKLYLYFTQLGKCMYTMKDIDIDDLMSNNYDIDHIYPQSLIKDDSLNNRVLCLKTFNENVKKDNFLFEVKNQMPSNINLFYELLLNNKMITTSKYRRLIERTITEEELDGFVNRQIVTTNQAVSGLIEVLKIYKNVDEKDIVFSKAENISDFRKKYDILKSRTANNYHHAHDAYLNVVVGRALNEYYKMYGLYGYRDYLKMKNNNYTIKPDVILSKNRMNNKTGEIIWDKEKALKVVNKNIKNRFDIHETTRMYKSNDLLKKVTILPAGESKNSVPVKTTDQRKDVEKYGGFTSNSFVKYCIVKTIDKKGIIEYILEPIPGAWSNREAKYLQNVFGKKFRNVEIINNDIRTNVVIERDKRKFCITGKTGECFGIKNLKDKNFPYDSIKTIRKIDKYIEKKKFGLFEIKENKIILSSGDNEVVITQNDINQLIDIIINIYSKEIFNYSDAYNSIISNLRKVHSFNNIEESVLVVNEVLKLLSTNSRSTANLELIGLSKNTGALTIGKKLQENDKVIAESITGYYKKMLFEVKSEF